MSEKDLIKQELKRILEQDLAIAKDVGKSLDSFKTQDDMKAESKYDTRSIEAGYLSSAQNKRIEELKHQLSLLDLMPLNSQTEISLGSIVELKEKHHVKTYFLSQVCGGSVLTILGKKIHVISILTPLGKELIGLKAREDFEVEIGGNLTEYQIQSVR